MTTEHEGYSAGGVATAASPAGGGTAQAAADVGWPPWTSVLALAAVTLLAVIVRAIGLGGELWLDEMYASNLSFRRSLADLITVFEGDNQHPLYSLLAHIGIALFGESPAAIRLPAFLFGCASIPALYLLGRAVTGRAEALLASALLAVSYHHVWFSQNARGYTMLAFWTVVSTLLLVRAIEERRQALFVAYAAAVALGIYTHLTMIFLVAAHVLICGWLTLWPQVNARGARLDWRLPVLGFGAGALLTLALYAPILDQVLNFFLNRPSRLLGVSTPAWAIQEGLRVLRLGLGGGPTVLVAGVIFSAGVVSYARRRPLVCALFLLPGLTTVAGALAGRGTMYPRFFFFLIGFALLILVRGAFATGDAAARMFRRPGWASPIAGTLVAGMIAASLLSLRYNYAHPKQAFQIASAYVAQNAAPGDPVAVINATWYAYNEYYGMGWHRLSFRDDPANDPTGNLERLRAGGRTVWLVYTFPRYIEHEAPGVASVIEAECSDEAKFDSTVGDGDLRVCALPPLTD